MKLKYYLRGLGIGIVVTVAVLTFASFGKKNPMTDAEIMKRAEELGMVKKESGGSILDSLKPKEGQTDGSDPSEGGTGQPGGSEAPEDGAGQPDGSNPSGDGAGQPDGSNPSGDGTGQPGASSAPEGEGSASAGQGNAGGVSAPSVPGDAQGQQNTMVTIQVGRGEFSDVISGKLLNAGLITDAESFNKYLIQSKVDSLISVGQYQIPRGASYAEIAKILSGVPVPSP